MPVADVKAVADRLRESLEAVILGQTEAIEQILVALFSEGHVLLEGVPGLGKTLLVRSLAQALDVSFSRVQFTPDLMPSDITGQMVYDMKSGEFRLRRGPVFANLLLADEINRTAPKTQAALLEAMQERQVTIDGQPQPLPDPFLVIATQNPVEYEGTYPLPEAQLDRFLLKVVLSYPPMEDEAELLRRAQFGPEAFRSRIEPVATAADLAACRQTLRAVRTEEVVIQYVNQICHATRDNPEVGLGASPRAAVTLLLAARALAAIAGRDYVTPDDVKEMALPVLRHRLILRPEAEVEGLQPEDAVAAALRAVAVPR
ncbi:MAG: AAA family ATPase [Symbiobacteriia bacterium]